MERNAKNIRKLKNISNKIFRLLILVIYIVNRNWYQTVFYYYLKKIGIKLEKPTFISKDVYLDSVDYSKITIKKDVVISINVTILVHDYSITRALCASGHQPDKELSLVKEVVIGENCFIGAGSIILPGTQIGNNTIIGAGSVVKGNIPNNVVAAGNPCQVLCSIEDYLEKQKRNNWDFLKANV
ncbi:acyltransferase [Priestia megaterium]|uniref:acyltransferase n=1 Tax=Priestia megaterium TaxID=1404 RepID=UPI00345A5F5D